MDQELVERPKIMARVEEKGVEQGGTRGGRDWAYVVYRARFRGQPCG